MRAILFISGCLFLAAAFYVARSIVSDIQVNLFATCLAASLLMFGQVAILSGQKSARSSQRTGTPEASRRDPPLR